MAEKKHIASTNIKTSEVVGEKQVPTVVPNVKQTRIREGQEVNRKDFTDEEWQRLVDSGAVTDDPLDLARPKTYKSSDVQQHAEDASRIARGVETDPEPQDETNPNAAQSAEDTNAQANVYARKVKEAEREFDERLATEPDFRAKLLVGYEGDPRQHQAIIHAAKQDYVAEAVEGTSPRAVPGRKKSPVAPTSAGKTSGDKEGDN